MRFLGQIVRLQIQRDRLKGDVDGRKLYDPSPVVPVGELTLTALGACARAPDGSYLVDVHNPAHPRTRNNQGVNPLSFLFTAHYSAMRERFGGHLAQGCAGENILIETADRVSLDDVREGLVVETRDGPVALAGVRVAAPCKAFSAFAMRAPAAGPEELKPALQFLDHGMRGFYCRYSAETPAVLRVGDRVFAASADGQPSTGAAGVGRTS